MAAPVLTVAGAGRLRIEGDLTFATIPALAGLHWQEGPLAVDLAGLGTTDSATVALLVTWVRAARQEGKVLTLEGLPERLRQLIGVHGLEPLFQDIVR